MGAATSNLQNHESFDNNNNKVQVQSPQKKVSNWRLLSKNQYRQILQSKRAGLLVERYTVKKSQDAEIFLVQNGDSDDKIFEWRNSFPNNQVVVSILSKQITNMSNEIYTNKNSSCSYSLCPHQENARYLHVVTQRILRLNEVQQMIKLIHQIDKMQKQQFLEQNQQKQKKIYKQKASYQPFLAMTINTQQGISILVDWVKGVEALCYKFGYFRINYQNLGITMHKRGNVWINDNFALNTIQHKNKINISTAEEKFKFEKDTINKIFTYAQGLNWFKKATADIGRFNLERFDDLYAYFQMNLQKRQIWKRNKIALQKGNYLNNNTLNNYQNSNSKISLQNSYNKKNRTRTLSSDEYIFQSCERLNLIHSDYNKKQQQKLMLLSPQQKSFNRSNTHNNLIVNSNIYVSPFLGNEKKLIYYKETAPSNEYIQQSFNSQKSHQNHQYINNNNQILSPNKFKQPKSGNIQSIYKSQIKHNKQIVNIQAQPQGIIETRKERRRVEVQNNNDNFIDNRNHNHNQNYNYRNHSFDEGCFRSQNLENMNKKKENISMDMGYLMGPQKHERIYKALKQQKIALIDSMVMVQQQSEQIQIQDQMTMMRDKVKVNLVMEQSVILRGLDEDQLNQYQYQQNMQNKAKKQRK